MTTNLNCCSICHNLNTLPTSICHDCEQANKGNEMNYKPIPLFEAIKLVEAITDPEKRRVERDNLAHLIWGMTEQEEIEETLGRR